MLLSCSHSFHLTCLRAWERFASRRSCPICRSAVSQRLAISDGWIAHQHKCATTIQASWRAYVARGSFERVHDVKFTSPSLQLRQLAQHVKVHGNALRVHRTQRDDVISNLFAECDRALITHRETFAAAEEWLLKAAGPETSSAGPSPDAAEHITDSTPAAHGSASVVHELNEPSWACAWAAVRQRADDDCSICMMPLNRLRGAGCSLLSCSHCFHEACISAFEGFEPERTGRPPCPLCRAPYSRIPMSALALPTDSYDGGAAATDSSEQGGHADCCRRCGGADQDDVQRGLRHLSCSPGLRHIHDS
jgi:Ring finger domain/IQ calmodulin-binding motif